MRSPRRRRTALLLALPLAVAPLATCGTEEASAAEIVRAAPAATVEATTARMAFEISMPGMPNMGGDAALTGTGAMDFEREIGSMTFDLGPIAEASGEPLPPGTPTEMEMVFEGTTYYMRFPMLAEALGPEAAGKEWVKIDAAAMAGDAGLDLGQLDRLGNDPRQQLAYLTGVSDHIEEVGEEEIRGERTTRYTGTVTMDAVLEQLEREELVDVDQFRRQVEELGIDEMAFDVWIDDEGRARRMEMAVPMPPQAGVAGGEVQMAIEMFDFGEAVDVAAPPADAVFDMTQMVRDQAAAAQGG